MSGGSYDYAFMRVGHGAEGMVRARHHLAAMQRDMIEAGYEAAAQIPGEILVMLSALDAMVARLYAQKALEVMKAFEWWRSADWGEDQFQDALLAYLDAVKEDKDDGDT